MDPDQTPQYAVSYQGLHCFPLYHEFLDTTRGGNIDLFNFRFVGLAFNGPVNTIKVMWSWSVYLTTLFPDRLSPLSD